MKKKIIFTAIFFISVFSCFAVEFDPMIIGKKGNEIKSILEAEGAVLDEINEVPGKSLTVYSYDTAERININYINVQIVQYFLNKKEYIVGANYIIYQENFRVEDYMSFILDFITDYKITLEKTQSSTDKTFTSISSYYGSNDELDFRFDICYSEDVGNFLMLTFVRI